jgi:Ca2+-binding RTX toxin-like protein
MPTLNFVAAPSAALTATFTGTAGDDVIIGSTGDDLIQGLAGNDTLEGDSGNDTLDGGDGDDLLFGGTGDDRMIGGLGNDFYFVDSVGDVVVELAGQGIDSVKSALNNYTLGSNVENLYFDGTGNFTGTCNELDNLIAGGIGNDTLDGGAGNDILIGGAGTDTLIGGTGNDFYFVDNVNDRVVEQKDEGIDSVKAALNSYTLGSNVENLYFDGTGDFVGTGNELNSMIFGGAGNDTLIGGIGNDTLLGGDGNDTLIGGAGADTLIGGAGNDTASYADATAGVTADLADSSFNTGDAAGDTYSGIENLTGSAFNDRLIGDANANVFDGGAGNDTVSYVSSTIGVTASLADPSVNTGAAAGDRYIRIENLEGTSLVDVLTGDNNDNMLFGRGGRDTLNGGGGNDTLFAFDTPTIGTFEFLNGGFGLDTADYRFADAAVTAVLGTSASDGTNGSATFGFTTDIYNSIENLSGSSFADTLSGNHANNVIEGRGGDDIMSGGDGGINTFVFHRGDGRDTILDFGIFSSIDIFEIHEGIFATTRDALRASTQTGNDVSIDLGGGQQIVLKNTTRSQLTAFNFKLLQDAPAPAGQTFTGGSGNDALIGGAGNDTLIGLDGDDTLIGGAGADTLIGGAGNDTASYANSTRDITANLADSSQNEGDAAGDTYNGIENLAGTSFADLLTGDNNDNLLFGMGGGDTLNGGGGNDILFAFDTPISGTFEFINGGFGLDTADYKFADAAVNAALGPAASDGTNGSATFGSTTDIYNSIENLSGSAFADTLTGSHANNVINGRGGDDIMSGGDGGIDTFVFHRGDGRDTILNFGIFGKIDIFEIHDGIFATAGDALRASRQTGNDVTIDLGGGQQITVKNTSLSKLSEFNFNIVQDGPASGSPASSAPTDSSLAQLVQAMSSFSPTGGDAMTQQMPVDQGMTGMIATPLHG